jgi:hypothetical protein
LSVTDINFILGMGLGLMLGGTLGAFMMTIFIGVKRSNDDDR